LNGARRRFKSCYAHHFLNLNFTQSGPCLLDDPVFHVESLIGRQTPPNRAEHRPARPQLSPMALTPRIRAVNPRPMDTETENPNAPQSPRRRRAA
jgi:hypothetical protein